QPGRPPQSTGGDGTAISAREAFNGALPSSRDSRRLLEGRSADLAERATEDSLPVVRQLPDRPERFLISERPQRERGEHYHPMPGTLDVRGEVGELIDALHTLFKRDRAVASQPGAVRCGICYLHHPLTALVYREAEGCYVCPDCAKALGATRLMMVRRQQRL